jgi:hypothetical protein
MARSIVVIGGGPAAVFAAIAAKKRDDAAEVVLLTEEGCEPYEKPPLSKAVLTGKAMPQDAPVAGPKGVGEAYVVTEGRCAQATGAGVPLEPNSAAFFVTQTAGKVLITREGPGSRSLYLDGRTHPSLTTWTPTAQGHSIARYENGDLMVETIGLTPGNVTAGGRRSPETMLRERFRLSPDGERLTITYTWEDPKIYVKPHSYSLAFERLPRGSYAIEDWCDPSDPAQRQSIVPPKQLN